jgi:triosephosphate isomerase
MLIAGNWKMNGVRSGAAAFLEGIAQGRARIRAGVGLLVCPPATLIAEMAEPLERLGVGLGGQDCHTQAEGAFTGDISAAMLADLGCGHVIVGHSERRMHHGETDLVVHDKAAAALAAGLIPIVCVGEHWADREAGHAEAVVKAQVRGSIPDGVRSAAFVVAYEPVWAIGSGRTPTIDDIAAMHHVIRDTLATKTGGGETAVLYGGSVKPGNAPEILALDVVGGALVGGASLRAEDFLAIAGAA